MLDNDHNATVSAGQEPDGHGSDHSEHGPAVQLVLHGESHAAVALHADAHQQPRAAGDAAVEAETREGTERVPQGPGEVMRSLNHLEGQRQQQEVGQRQAEQEDVWTGAGWGRRTRPTKARSARRLAGRPKRKDRK